MKDISLIRTVTNREGAPSAGDLSTAHRLPTERRHQAPDVRLPHRQGTRPRRVRFAVVRQRPRPFGEPGIPAGQVRSIPSRRSLAHAGQRRSHRSKASASSARTSAHERPRPDLCEDRVGVARRKSSRSLRIGVATHQEPAAASVRRLPRNRPRLRSATAPPRSARDACSLGGSSKPASPSLKSSSAIGTPTTTTTTDARLSPGNAIPRSPHWSPTSKNEAGSTTRSSSGWASSAARRRSMPAEVATTSLAHFNVALAGCGVKGGRVVGKTSEDGQSVADRPVTVPDLSPPSLTPSASIPPRKTRAASAGPSRSSMAGRTSKNFFRKTYVAAPLDDAPRKRCSEFPYHG